MEAEFSRPFRVDRIAAAGSEIEITADEAERRALADRFGLVEVGRLGARLRLKPLAGGLVRVTGRLGAEVVQSCVVTLEPVPASLDEELDITFGPEGHGQDDDEDEIELTFEGEDPPDPIVDGAIDLGEVVAEQLALALDPFPRAPGAEFRPPPEDQPAEEPRRNPFAALAALKEKKR